MDTAGLEEPKLLQKGLIVPSEVDLLFSIYWDKINVCRYLVFYNFTLTRIPTVDHHLCA